MKRLWILTALLMASAAGADGYCEFKQHYVSYSAGGEDAGIAEMLRVCKPGDTTYVPVWARKAIALHCQPDKLARVDASFMLCVLKKP